MIRATYIDHMGSDLSVVNAARVSFGKNSKGEKVWVPTPEGEQRLDRIPTEKDKKLIQYLAKHKHISPFGHCFASFHVKAPIFVARQLVKHKFLRWNEISRRYVDDEPEFYEPDYWRKAAPDKKQGSLDEHVVYDNEGYVIGAESMSLHKHAFDLYNEMIDAGVAPEQARMVLPQSTMTEWYWSGSLDAFAAMCKLRCAPDTQYESRIVADQISETMGKLFPVSWEALMEEAH